MGAMRRAVRYLRRKPGKTAVLAAVMAVACGMALLSLCILDSSRELSAALKQATVPEVAAYRQDGAGLVPDDLAAQLAELPAVKSANRLRTVDATPADFENIEGTAPDPGFDDAVRLHACDDLASAGPFADQLVRLVEGSLVAPGDEHAAVLHVDLAEANGLRVGDTVTLAGANGTTVEARIAGLYAAAGGNEGGGGGATARNQSFNQLYVDNATASDLGARGFSEVRLALADAERANEAAAEIGRTCGEGYATEVYDSALSQLAPSLDQAAAAAQAALVLVAITGTTATAMLLALWGRTRARERAVLLSLGTSKASVVLQSLAESALLFAAAAAAASCVAVVLSPALIDAVVPSAALQAAQQAGATATRGLAASDAAAVTLAGFAVVMLVSGACALVALRRNPREMLTDKG